MKSQLKLILMALAVISIAACGNSDKHSALKGEFLHSCLNSGSSKAYCTCSYDYLTNKHTKEELVTIFTSFDHFDTLNASLTEAKVACLQ